MGLGISNPNGHAFFVLAMAVLLVCIAGVQLVRKGTTGRFLGAMRGSDTAAAGLGINLTWQHVLVFGLSGAVAGIGGTMLSIQQQQVNPQLFVYEISLVFVVVVVTTGASTVEGALQAGFGFVVLQQLLTYVPARFGGNSLVVVFFAFGALTYAAHPEGILEYQKAAMDSADPGHPVPHTRRPARPGRGTAARTGGPQRVRPGVCRGPRPGDESSGHRPWMTPPPHRPFSRCMASRRRSAGSPRSAG